MIEYSILPEPAPLELLVWLLTAVIIGLAVPTVVYTVLDTIAFIVKFLREWHSAKRN